MHGAPRVSFRIPPAAKIEPDETSSTPQAIISDASSNVASFSTVYPSRNNGTLLPIVPVAVTFNGLHSTTYALLDLASEITMIKTWVANALCLDGPTTIMSIGTANGPSPLRPVKRVNFLVSSVERDFECLIENAAVLDSFDVSNDPVNVEKLVED